MYIMNHDRFNSFSPCNSFRPFNPTGTGRSLKRGFKYGTFGYSWKHCVHKNHQKRQRNEDDKKEIIWAASPGYGYQDPQDQTCRCEDVRHDVRQLFLVWSRCRRILQRSKQRSLLQKRMKWDKMAIKLGSDHCWIRWMLWMLWSLSRYAAPRYSYLCHSHSLWFWTSMNVDSSLIGEPLVSPGTLEVEHPQRQVGGKCCCWLWVGEPGVTINSTRHLFYFKGMDRHFLHFLDTFLFTHMVSHALKLFALIMSACIPLTHKPLRSWIAL